MRRKTKHKQRIIQKGRIGEGSDEKKLKKHWEEAR
jgi:hypothetical protein